MRERDETDRPDGPERRDAQDQPHRHPRRVAEVLRARDLHPLLALINQAEPLCPTRLAVCEPGDGLAPMQSFEVLWGPTAAVGSPLGAAPDLTPNPWPVAAPTAEPLPVCALGRGLAIGDQAAVRIEVMPVPGLGDAAYLIVLSSRAPPAGATTGPTRGAMLEEVNVWASDPRLLALGLTPRQADIVARLALGQSNKAIARALDIAPATVKKHLEDAYRRLGVRNRTEAALAARSAISA